MFSHQCLQETHLFEGILELGFFRSQNQENHHALENKLDTELNQSKQPFLANVYLECVITLPLDLKLRSLMESKCLVHLGVLYIRDYCEWVPIVRYVLIKYLLQSDGVLIRQQSRIFFSTRRAFPSVHKDVLPTYQQSLVIYQYKCQCEADFVGKTIQQLEVRIAQHVTGQIQSYGHITDMRL